jgi:hypothetical protein
MKTTSSIAIYLAIVVALLTQASPVLASDKFLVFDYLEIHKKHLSWSTADQQKLQQCLADFEENNQSEVDLSNTVYLIIPNRIASEDSFRTWVVLKDSHNSTTQGLYLQQVSVLDDFLGFLWRLNAAGKISEVNDAVVLDDQDVRDLLRLAWFNSQSISDSPGALNARFFNSQFVQNESRSWFLDSPPRRRLLLLKGLTSSSLSTAYLCLPEHKGPTPFLEIASDDRAILVRALESLRSEWIPATLTINLKFAGISHLPSELDDLIASIEVHFEEIDRSDFLGTIQGHKLEGETITLELSIPRKVLASTAMNLVLRKSEFRILNIDRDRFSDYATQRIPEPQEILGTPARFDIWVAKVGRAQDFRSHGLWSGTADIGEMQILFDPNTLLVNRRSHGPKIAIDVLFDSPKEFLSSLDPDVDPLKRRHRDEADRAVLDTIAGTKEIREAIWRHIMIGLDSIQKPNQILLIKNVGGPTTSKETRDNADRYFSLLQLFIKSRLKITTHSDVQLLTSERRAVDSRHIGAVDIIVFSLGDP